MAIERLFQHPWRGNFSPQFTCTKTSTQNVYIFDAERRRTNTADENLIRKKKEKE
jgi:hypothetical protein